MSGAVRAIAFAASALAVALVLAAGCGDEKARAYALQPGDRVSLYVTVSEHVDSTPALRQIEVYAAGAAKEGDVAVLRIERFVVRRRGGADTEVRVIDTAEVAADPSTRAAADRPLQRVFELLRGRELRMRLDPTAGVVGVEGWDAALDDAGEEAGPEVADAVLGLRNALGDEVWRRDLRAAGLQEIPDGLLRPAGRLRRNVEIALPGLGTTTIEVVGPVSQEHDGSPAVELRGQPARDAAWSPLPGAAPPAELGGVASDRVEATVATVYTPRSLLPMRGRLSHDVPYASGLVLRRRFSFTFIVR